MLARRQALISASKKPTSLKLETQSASKKPKPLTLTMPSIQYKHDNDIKNVFDILKHTKATYLDELFITIKNNNYILEYYILGYWEDNRIIIYVESLKNKTTNLFIPLTHHFFYNSTGTSRPDGLNGYFLLFDSIIGRIGKPEDNIRLEIENSLSNIHTTNKIEYDNEIEKIKLKFNIHELLIYGRLLNETNLIISKLLKYEYENNTYFKINNIKKISSNIVNHINIYDEKIFLTELETDKNITKMIFNITIGGKYKHKSHKHKLHKHKLHKRKSHKRKSHKGKSHKGKSHKGKSHKSKSHKSKSHKSKSHKSKLHKSKSHKSKLHKSKSHKLTL